MIINKSSPTLITQTIVRSCMRFAKQMGLQIVEEETRFTILEALQEEDEFWVSKIDVIYDDCEEFIRMCCSYTNSIENVPIGNVTLQVSCPNCHNCVLTPKQFRLNTIHTPAGPSGKEQAFVVCNNCGEIMRLADTLHIT